MSDSSFTAFVVDQLVDLGAIDAHEMFGGHGLYRDGTIFGIVYDDRLYLKTGDAGAERFRAHGMEPFTPRPGQTLGRYYRVPDDVLEHRERLTIWSRDAIDAADS